MSKIGVTAMLESHDWKCGTVTNSFSAAC